MANLLLGPLLRRVDGDQAVIWVQTDRPVQVTVAAAGVTVTSDTFTAFGTHIGVAVLSGLPVGANPYTVSLDGAPVWPPPELPPSVVTVRDPADGDATIVFGSCREATGRTHAARGHDPDVLEALAARLLAGARTGQAALPDLLALIGDQIYADELSAPTVAWLAEQERHPQAPPRQVVGFAEYVHLYHESWTDPEVRWLLSTVPTVMVFDDHEIIDDWNSSAGWLAAARREPWWDERITAGLASYWLFQHLGNLTPAQLERDPVWTRVRAGGDATAVLTEFARRASTPAGDEPYQWGYTVDVGRTRLIMMDCRGNRVLDRARRRMWPQEHWDALARQAAADCDHLVLACSLPWLLAPVIHHGEAVIEVLAARHGGAEKLRQKYDLEHWAAVGDSFDELTALIAGVRGPATVSVLGGDVHHSYVARADVAGATAQVHQIVCSPLHQSVRGVMRTLLRLGWWRVLSGPAWLVARAFGVPRPRVRWRTGRPPYFGTAVATLTHRGRSADVLIEGAHPGGRLTPVLQHRLADTPTAPTPAPAPAPAPAATGS
ncbi:alkaline phosphatase [Catellatospora sp. TT07R-123]|uniref:alkaline phosphatase D family protein n=1 Tax=Catellatospora sp. TT07R-123 TaxID=2733863 RepID=UPI001B1D5A47|nr:alkaline phosphatase D family protein [Catellatospora sp. TT07R-123]GHJ49825.1 alkaline phosphatase [Catellatospora sp. TT07R-123]